MLKTIQDIDGKECFFNENDRLCKGYTYIDIYKNICNINTQSNPHPIKLNWITSYSSFADDPMLGELASGDPDNTDFKGNNIDNRKYWLHQIRKKRNHQAAGGDGTYYNPITTATSSVGNSDDGNQLGGFNNEVGNIYWIPYFKKYIVIEDINETGNSASSLDIWVGINSTSHNNISYYTNTTGDNIAINCGNKLFSYEDKDGIYSSTVNKKYTKWDNDYATSSNSQPNKYTFVNDIKNTCNNPKVNKYIYTNISAIGNNTLSKEDGKIIYAWLAPSGGFTSVTPDPYPIINFGYPSWDSQGSPISKLSDKTISDGLKNLSNDTLYSNFSLSDNAGLFCQTPPCLATGDNKSNPYQTASAEHYYLPT